MEINTQTASTLQILWQRHVWNLFCVFVCLFVCLFVGLYVCLFVCLFVVCLVLFSYFFFVFFFCFFFFCFVLFCFILFLIFGFRFICTSCKPLTVIIVACLGFESSLQLSNYGINRAYGKRVYIHYEIMDTMFCIIW